MSSQLPQNPQSEIRDPKSSGDPLSGITDSPWFWALAFSLMALLALAVVGFSGKYGRRQSGIEVKYQARERIVEKMAAENNPASPERTEEQQDRRPFATPDNNLITLWPLAIVLALVAIVSGAMLIRASRAGPVRKANP